MLFFCVNAQCSGARLGWSRRTRLVQLDLLWHVVFLFALFEPRAFTGRYSHNALNSCGTRNTKPGREG